MSVNAIAGALCPSSSLDSRPWASAPAMVLTQSTIAISDRDGMLAIGASRKAGTMRPHCNRRLLVQWKQESRPAASRVSLTAATPSGTLCARRPGPGGAQIAVLREESSLDQDDAGSITVPRRGRHRGALVERLLDGDSAV